MGEWWAGRGIPVFLSKMASLRLLTIFLMPSSVPFLFNGTVSVCSPKEPGSTLGGRHLIVSPYEEFACHGCDNDLRKLVSNTI